MADRTGQQLGNYRLIRKLGEGGFAEVYQAENIHIGTQAAIKLLFTRMGQDEIEDFKREARTLANLMHPHIVRVLDFGVDNSIPYLVMDYAPGGTLRTRHPKGSRLPLPTIVEYIKQVASALQYAHDQKIVHRDIKPENMLIGRNGEILLSDFGIALIAQSSRYQSTKDMAGTIAYMAPEQIQAHPRSASDQYSLAIVAYEWLCGTRPFHGSYSEIAVKHSVTSPPPLRDQLPELPSGVEQVIMTALAKKPDDRFKSVKAFGVALEYASISTSLKSSQAPTKLPTSSSPSTLTIPIRNNITSEVRHPLIDHSFQTAHAQVVTPIQPHIISTSVATNQSTITPASDTFIPAPIVRPDKKLVRRISRRAVISSAATIAVAGIGGSGAIWLMHTFFFSQGRLYLTYQGHTNAVNSVTWSPDGKYIASASSDKTVQVWNASNGNLSFSYNNHTAAIGSVAWSPKGKYIASASNDGTVQVWNASDGNRIFTYQGHIDSVNVATWSPDGKYIASASDDLTVQVWNARDGSHGFTYRGHADPVYDVAWSPDGEHIASASSDKTVQVWNANDGSHPFIYQGHTLSVNSVTWSPDGKRIASASSDKTVQVWNANDGSHPFIYQGHNYPVYSVAWSSDRQRIASASSDKTVQVWDANDGSYPFIYQGHTSIINSVAWSSNGQRIASASDDQTVQVWQAV